MKTIKETLFKTTLILALALGLFFAIATTVDAYGGGGGDEGCCGSTPTTPTAPTGGGGGGSYTPNPPVCNISASLSVAEVNEEFLVTWSGSPTSADFWINGYKLQDVNDSATYTFNGEFDYMRFTIYGENQDGSCGDEVIINKKVVTPAPTCDMFAANPTTILWLKSFPM